MDERVKAAIVAMTETLKEDLSIDNLSRKVNLSPSRLRELFKKHTGRSPKQYVKKLRMERAEHLLGNTFLSVKEVTFLSGMRDVSHFVNEFKKRHGITPSQFRARRRVICMNVDGFL